MGDTGSLELSAHQAGQVQVEPAFSLLYHLHAIGAGPRDRVCRVRLDLIAAGTDSRADAGPKALRKRPPTEAIPSPKTPPTPARRRFSTAFREAGVSWNMLLPARDSPAMFGKLATATWPSS